MKCRYSDLDLKVALIGLEKKLTEHLQEAIARDLEAAGLNRGQTRSELNQLVADHHGISVEKLLGSPNLKILTETYQEDRTFKFISILEQNDLTNKEAWALVYFGSGSA